MTQAWPPIERYARQRQLALADELRGRRAIYLDTKFWILLRDAACGRGTLRACELLGRLRGAVAIGQVFCPVSDMIFLELFKQADRDSRRRTAAVMQELSLGVSLLDERMRTSTEIAHLFHTHAPDAHETELHPMRDLVWTRAAYAMGYRFLDVSAFPPEARATIQQGAFDAAWDAPLVELIDNLEDADPDPSLGLADLAKQLTRESAAHAHTLKSFRQTYIDELAGAADVFADQAVSVIRDMAAGRGEPTAEPGSTGWVETRRQARNLIFLALKKGTAQQALRSLHVFAALHAATRWDRSRGFDGNDFFDFSHAAVALAYCDGFFVEGSLGSLIRAKHLALDEMFGCQVATSLDEAIAIVRG